jgi:glutamate-5-semialdehyde dehydrogenase
MSKEKRAMDNSQINAIVTEMARQARLASRKLVALPTEVKNTVLLKTANVLMEQRDFIAEQNELDLEAGRKKGLSA